MQFSKFVGTVVACAQARKMHNKDLERASSLLFFLWLFTLCAAHEAWNKKG